MDQACVRVYWAYHVIRIGLCTCIIPKLAGISIHPQFEPKLRCTTIDPYSQHHDVM